MADVMWETAGGGQIWIFWLLGRPCGSFVQLETKEGKMPAFRTSSSSSSLVKTGHVCGMNRLLNFKIIILSFTGCVRLLFRHGLGTCCGVLRMLTCHDNNWPRHPGIELVVNFGMSTSLLNWVTRSDGSVRGGAAVPESDGDSAASAHTSTPVENRSLHQAGKAVTG